MARRLCRSGLAVIAVTTLSCAAAAPWQDPVPPEQEPVEKQELGFAVRVETALTSGLEARFRDSGFFSPTIEIEADLEEDTNGLGLEFGDRESISWLLTYRSHDIGYESLTDVGFVSRLHLGEDTPVTGLLQVGLLLIEPPAWAESGMILGIEFGGGVDWAVTEDFHVDLIGRYLLAESGSTAIFDFDETRVDGFQLLLGASYWF